MSKQKYSLIVLISGNGSNLQNLINKIDNNELKDTKIELVIADRNCYGIERAINHEIPTFLVDKNNNVLNEIDEIITNELNYNKKFIIVLAGFLSILSDEFCEKYKNQIINIHPSLLPKYGGKGMYGKNVHKQVLKNKDTKSGVSVHYVIPEIDKGEIIIQKEIDIDNKISLEDLMKKINELEYLALPEAIEKIINNNG